MHNKHAFTLSYSSSHFRSIFLIGKQLSLRLLWKLLFKNIFFYKINTKNWLLLHILE